MKNSPRTKTSAQDRKSPEPKEPVDSMESKQAETARAAVTGDGEETGRTYVEETELPDDYTGEEEEGGRTYVEETELPDDYDPAPISSTPVDPSFDPDFHADFGPRGPK